MRTIREEKMARDPELFVNMVNNDPQHIARAKAKRERVLAKSEKKVTEPEDALIKVLAGFSTWALVLVCLL